jgi:hypothetical protein
MSNRPHIRAPRRPVDPLLTRLAIKASSALRGCTCAPNITHRRDGTVTVAHDSWCPAHDTGMMLVGLPKRRHR